MTPLAGLVLTGAPGRALADVVNHQVVSQIQGAPDGAQLIARYQELIRRFESGLPFVPDPALPAGVNNLVAALSAPANQPFTREFWAFRPAEYLGRIVEPVLVIIGKKDVQCDWQLDGAALEAAAGARTNMTFRYPEHANHILKTRAHATGRDRPRDGGPGLQRGSGHPGSRNGGRHPRLARAAHPLTARRDRRAAMEPESPAPRTR